MIFFSKSGLKTHISNYYISPKGGWGDKAGLSVSSTDECTISSLGGGGILYSLDAENTKQY